jgi:RimJ/RimL family protein N-acetyltransferase
MLSTERLLIRDWVPEDAATVVDIYHRVEVVKWLGDGDPVPCHDEDQARRWIENWRGRADPPLGYWAIEATGGPLAGRTVGSVLLVPLPKGEGAVEIGWSLHPDAWGHGYAAEAGRAVLRRGFEGGLEEIHAVTHLTNEASMAVCRRIGMTHTGIVHTWYDKPSQHYLLTKERWLRSDEQ